MRRDIANLLNRVGQMRQVRSQTEALEEILGRATGTQPKSLSAALVLAGDNPGAGGKDLPPSIRPKLGQLIRAGLDGYNDGDELNTVLTPFADEAEALYLGLEDTPAWTNFRTGAYTTLTFERTNVDFDEYLSNVRYDGMPAYYTTLDVLAYLTSVYVTSITGA